MIKWCEKFVVHTGIVVEVVVVVVVVEVVVVVVVVEDKSEGFLDGPQTSVNHKIFQGLDLNTVGLKDSSSCTQHSLLLA
jgi:hypothetical protein